MYHYLLIFHSFFRWLVLATLLFAIFKASIGYYYKKTFTKSDNAIRHWTATIAHIQLMTGIILYVKSPIIHYLWSSFSLSLKHLNTVFFGLYHIILMLGFVVLVTVGSAMAKRKNTDKEKFETMLKWYGLSLIIVFIAIPWPFSPLANRPYIRSF